MKIRNLLLAGLVPVLAWSCSDDKLQGGENTPPSTASQNYMEVSIKMPITTRWTRLRKLCERSTGCCSKCER